MKINNCWRLFGSFCWCITAALVSGGAEAEIGPAEVLARIKTSIQAKDTHAIEVACKEASRLVKESSEQQGPDEMARREKLEFRLSVLERIVAGIEKNAKPEIVYHNIGAPGVPLSGMDPQYVKDPVVRKEYERRIAENNQRSEKNLRNDSLARLREKWIENVSFFVAQNYGKDYDDVAEIRRAINLTVDDSTRRTELEQLLKIEGK